VSVLISGEDTPAVGVSAPPYLRLRGLPATAAAISRIRERLLAWVRRTGLDEDQVADIGLAVYEAMANVVDHAYQRPGGVFDLYAFRHEGQVTVTVTDSGQWKPPVHQERPLRGRGLLIMRQVAREFELTVHSRGTIVRMSWRTRWGARLKLPRLAVRPSPRLA
jgi:serine/threonine-protein kinase RsbW